MNTITKNCTRQGCRQKFTEPDESPCYYHDGKPLFHDVKKGWTCCNVIVYDWEEFVQIKGCKVGIHTDEKSKDTEFSKSNTVSNAENGLKKFGNTGISGNTNNCSSEITNVKDVKIYEEEQRKKEEERKKKEAEKPKEILQTKDGMYYCGNIGCLSKTYNPDSNKEGDCQHHLGQPVFHDRKKYWNCCKQEAYDWDDFMKLPPCAVGMHVPKYKN